MWERVGWAVPVLLGCEGALVVENLPATGGLAPNGRPACASGTLDEHIGDQVRGVPECLAEGFLNLPLRQSGIHGWVSGEELQEEGAGISLSGGPNLPIVWCHQPFEILSG